MHVVMVGPDWWGCTCGDHAGPGVFPAVPDLRFAAHYTQLPPDRRRLVEVAVLWVSVRDTPMVEIARRLGLV